MTVVPSGIGGEAGIGYLVLVAYEGPLPASRLSSGTEEDCEHGFHGSSEWVGVGESETAIRLLHYEDQASADERLRERVESSEAPPEARDVPPVVNHLVIEKQHGRTLEGAAIGTYLTAIHFVAAPGYGDVAAQQIEETLESLELVEGYAGHVRGFNVAFPDDVWALVFWSSPPVMPVPPDIEGATLEHYRRVN